MLATSRTLVTVTLFAPLVFSGALQAGEPLSLEVFTAATFPITGKDDRRLRNSTVTIYAVDGLERFEASLSQDLPVQEDAAKAEAMRRIGELDEARMAPAKEAAIGLAKTIQYGVDRYPAIVLDGHAVIYGVTDLVDALARYGSWREAGPQ